MEGVAYEKRLDGTSAAARAGLGLESRLRSAFLPTGRFCQFFLRLTSRLVRPSQFEFLFIRKPPFGSLGKTDLPVNMMAVILEQKTGTAVVALSAQGLLGGIFVLGAMSLKALPSHAQAAASFYFFDPSSPPRVTAGSLATAPHQPLGKRSANASASSGYSKAEQRDRYHRRRREYVSGVADRAICLRTSSNLSLEVVTEKPATDRTVSLRWCSVSQAPRGGTAIHVGSPPNHDVVRGQNEPSLLSRI
jgi:hypothetical protein